MLLRDESWECKIFELTQLVVVEVVCVLHLISNFLSRMHLKIFVKYSLILQKWVPVMGGCWTWLFSLFGLFCNVYSFCISEENESDIWNIWKMIGSFPVTFTERQASQFKITVFYFYPARVLKVLSRSPAPSSGLSSPNRPIVVKESVSWKYIKQSSQQLSVLCGN